MPRFLPESPATVNFPAAFLKRRKAGPLLCILPILAVSGLGLLGIAAGTGQRGAILRGASLSTPSLDAPLPTAPLTERLDYTRGLYREDLCTFQAKMDFWRAAAHTPGAAGRHARQKLAQWQRLSQQTRHTLDRQTRREQSAAF